MKPIWKGPHLKAGFRSRKYRRIVTGTRQPQSYILALPRQRRAFQLQLDLAFEESGKDMSHKLRQENDEILLMATRNPAWKPVEGKVVHPHYLQSFIHPSWCRMFSINSTSKMFFSPRFVGDSIQFDELGCSTTNVSSFGNHNHVESPTTENPPTITTSRPWALLQSSKRPGDCKHFDGAVVGGTPHDLDGMHLSLAGVQEQGLREAWWMSLDTIFVDEVLTPWFLPWLCWQPPWWLERMDICYADLLTIDVAASAAVSINSTANGTIWMNAYHMARQFLLFLTDLDICRISNRASHKQSYSLQRVNWLEDATSTSTETPIQVKLEHFQTHPEGVSLFVTSSLKVEACLNVWTWHH